MLPDVVTEKLDALPASPGVYLFKDRRGGVVYVGKAKSLRSRVRSYFQGGSTDNRYFIPILQRTIGDLDTIVTATEKEAAILENTLIKEHRPRYNVKLRDDKDYISLKLDPKDAWPRLWVVRRPSYQPGETARYFGPYHSATAARRTLHLVNKHFQLRTCTDTEMRSRKRPCLQHQIKRCPAPCVLEVDRAWYDEQVRAVAMFLDGRHDELSEELAARMQAAARAMRFELAAVYRDQIHAVEKVREEQRVVSVDDVDRDVLGIHREADLVELALLHVRRGKLADVATFSVKNAEVPDEEVVAAFLAQHYALSSSESGADASAAALPIPDEIIVPTLPDAASGTAEWLSERAAHKVALLCPQRGPRVDLLRLANENASHAFTEKRRASDDVQERLTQLKERLRLPTVPRRIECCDISHLGGQDTVGAVVAMTDGEPDKKRYRTFHVRGEASASKATDGAPTPGGGEGTLEQDVDGVPVSLAGDDYRAMYEVLARRFRRGLKRQEARELSLSSRAPAAAAGEPGGAPPEDEGDASEGADVDWDLPDLFVVDGGRGQLAVALAAARDLGLHDLPIVALAKEKENVAGDTLVDRVYLPGQKNPIPLKSHSASMFFLARARDEAHRFSNRARERLGKKKRMRSALDDVAGIGPKTKQSLLLHLGSLKAIKAADDAQILAVPGVTARHLKALRRVYPAKTPAP
ncbi:MAG: excinuclease ABC subunit UvrC [Labilithrix sp.]|nr:excinuclease ABC subunit UvrC [Labilithrix sp.]MCW5834411.1 excinuclease ABC subunit UvrC [Labilithrix sp.]